MAENPQKSIRQLARYQSMDLRITRNLVKENLGVDRHVIVPRPFLAPSSQELKKERCRTLLNNLKASQPHFCISPFSKAPLKQMVLWVVGSDGQKCPIVLVGIGE
jgi:hypothetical protein